MNENRDFPEILSFAAAMHDELLFSPSGDRRSGCDRRCWYDRGVRDGDSAGRRAADGFYILAMSDCDLDSLLAVLPNSSALVKADGALLRSASNETDSSIWRAYSAAEVLMEKTRRAKEKATIPPPMERTENPPEFVVGDGIRVDSSCYCDADGNVIRPERPETNGEQSYTEIYGDGYEDGYDDAMEQVERLGEGAAVKEWRVRPRAPGEEGPCLKIEGPFVRPASPPPVADEFSTVSQPLIPDRRSGRDRREVDLRPLARGETPGRRATDTPPDGVEIEKPPPCSEQDVFGKGYWRFTPLSEEKPPPRCEQDVVGETYLRFTNSH